MSGKVFIVLVNYTKYQDTIECLESIFKSSYTNIQVLVIDNSPDDTSLVNIKKWVDNDYQSVQTLYPDLVYPLIQKPVKSCFVTNTEFEQAAEVYDAAFVLVKTANDGFAAANNVALRYVQKNADNKSFIWLLNNDTVVDKCAIEELVWFYKKNSSNHWVICSKLLSYHHRNQIQAIIGDYNKWTGSGYHIGEGEDDRGQYDNYKVSSSNYLVGASMFLPCHLIKQIGLMAEGYFLYFEDIDWSMRAINSGLKLAVQPTAIVYHKEGGTNTTLIGNEANRDMPGYYTLINRVKFTKRWYPTFTATVYAGVLYGLLKRIGQGKIKLVKKAVRALLNTDKLLRY